MSDMHDSLCPSVYVWGVCECVLISRVRDDERRRYVSGLDRIIREIDMAEKSLNEHINLEQS